MSDTRVVLLSGSRQAGKTTLVQQVADATMPFLTLDDATTRAGAIAQRDVRDVAQIDHIRRMPRLPRVLAQHAGQLANYSQIGAPLGMNHVTVRKSAGIFESLFLFRTVQPRYSNALKRATKTPKLHFRDAGLFAAPLSVLWA